MRTSRCAPRTSCSGARPAHADRVSASGGGDGSPRPSAPSRMTSGCSRRRHVTPEAPCCRTATTTSRSPTRAAATAGGATSPSRGGAKTRPGMRRGPSVTCATSRAVSFWSVAHQPTLRAATGYEAVFSQGRAEFRRRDEEIGCHVEISVSPEDDIELRRITISNHGRTKRTIELTSFAEVVLATPASDASHRTFSNLFVQTELDRDRHAILCTRRPRSGGEKPPWMLHLMVAHGATLGPRRSRPIARHSSVAVATSRIRPRCTRAR